MAYMNSDSQFLPLNHRRTSRPQQYKMRTLICIVSVTLSCMIILSLTSASPLSNTDDSDNSIATSKKPTSTDEYDNVYPVVGEFNGTKLVITHIIKTLEFEVGIEEDGNATDDSTSSTPSFVETEIDVLNPELLKEVVKHLPSTEQPELSIDGTKYEKNEEAL